MQEKTLKENLMEKYKGVPGAFEPIECLKPQKTMVNSWFYIGRCSSNGHNLTFLLHFMCLSFKNTAGIMDVVISVLDKTTGFYESCDELKKMVHPVKVRKNNVEIVLKKAAMSGSLDGKIILSARLKEASFDVEVSPIGDVIFNAGTGYFPLLTKKQNYQYSCPFMKMNGTITIKGKKYAVEKGDLWYDRQWNSPELSALMNIKEYDPKWLWHGIRLNNDVILSIWELFPKDGTDFCFATVLNKDKTQSLYYVKPLIKYAGEPWHSDITGQNYPTKWRIIIPDMDADLTVICTPKEQEIISEMATLNKYEAESSVEGVIGKESVSGVACVEILGNWKNTFDF